MFIWLISEYSYYTYYSYLNGSSSAMCNTLEHVIICCNSKGKWLIKLCRREKITDHQQKRGGGISWYTSYITRCVKPPTYGELVTLVKMKGADLQH